MQDVDVGPDTEMAYPDVEKVLRLIRRVDLGTGRNAHLDGGLEHSAFDDT